MKCEKCGNMNSEDQVNCTECGEPLEKTGIEEVVESVAKPLVNLITAGLEEGTESEPEQNSEKASAEYEEAPLEDGEEADEAALEETEEAEDTDLGETSAADQLNNKKKNTLRMALGIILILLVGTFAVVYFNQKGRNAAPEEINVEAPTANSVIPVGNKETVATLNDQPIKQSVFNLYFWITQQNFESAGPNIWEMETGGMKAIDLAKESTLKDIKLSIAAVQKTNDLGIALTDEEKKMAYDQANEIMTTNLDLGPKLQADITDMEEFLLHRIYVQKALEALSNAYKPTEEEINAEMQAVQAKYETATVKHVLIGSKDEEGKALAEEVLQKALAGEDMAELAKAYSEDPGSKDSGGEYTFPKGQMVAEFENASFTGEIGKVYPELVETSFGYHIIKVENRTSGDIAQIKEESERAAKYKYAQNEIIKLSETIKVETTPLYDKVEVIK